MADSGQETKSSPTDKFRQNVVLSFCILFVVVVAGNSLMIALFVRTEMKFQKLEAACLKDESVQAHPAGEMSVKGTM